MKSHAAYLGTALLLTGLTLGTIAQATNTYADGWIGHVNGRQLDICYRVRPLPAVGTRLQVMRLAYVIPGKGVPIEHSPRAGKPR